MADTDIRFKWYRPDIIGQAQIAILTSAGAEKEGSPPNTLGLVAGGFEKRLGELRNRPPWSGLVESGFAFDAPAPSENTDCPGLPNTLLPATGLEKGPAGSLLGLVNTAAGADSPASFTTGADAKIEPLGADAKIEPPGAGANTPGLEDMWVSSGAGLVAGVDVRTRGSFSPGFGAPKTLKAVAGVENAEITAVDAFDTEKSIPYDLQRAKQTHLTCSYIV